MPSALLCADTSYNDKAVPAGPALGGNKDTLKSGVKGHKSVTHF